MSERGKGKMEEKGTTEEIRKTIVVEAPPEAVFKALTDEKELVQWMPREAKMDARVGGEYEFKYRWADRALDTVLRGKILELEPNRRLSYTWDTETPDHQRRISGAVVTWLLDDLSEGKTRVTLIHSGVGKQFSKDAEMGWNYFLGRLASYSKG
jgi:uncharacterized protein YndB with AHSA1/START domain